MSQGFIQTTRIGLANPELRLYFIGSALDGLLVGLGVVTAVLLEYPSMNPSTMELALSTAAGFALAGLWRPLVRSVEESDIGTQDNEITQTITLMRSLGATLSISFLAVPFAFEGMYLTSFSASVSAGTITFGSLFILGTHFGALLNLPRYRIGIRMVGAGVLVVVLTVIPHW